MLRTPLRAPALAALRAAVRSRPELRLVTAPAFYAGEVLGEAGGPLVGRLKTGAEIHLLAADEVHRHIWFYGEYEAETTRFVRSVAARGWTVLDVGANAGYYSLLAADLGGPASRIHAFEPNPTLADLLMASATTRPCVTVVRAACGDHAGSGRLSLSTDPSNTGLATLQSATGPAARTTVVPIVTLDGYCAEHGLAPELIKIDVEGYEPEVLRGADRLLSDRVPAHVVCEVVPDRWAPGPVIASMADRGYAVRSIAADGSLRPYEDRTYQNVVFVRE